MATAVTFLIIFLFLNFLDNLAFRKTTHESSTYSRHSPGYAVDGVIGDNGEQQVIEKTCNHMI